MYISQIKALFVAVSLCQYGEPPGDTRLRPACQIRNNWMQQIVDNIGLLQTTCETLQIMNVQLCDTQLYFKRIMKLNSVYYNLTSDYPMRTCVSFFKKSIQMISVHTIRLMTGFTNTRRTAWPLELLSACGCD